MNRRTAGDEMRFRFPCQRQHVEYSIVTRYTVASFSALRHFVGGGGVEGGRVDGIKTSRKDWNSAVTPPQIIDVVSFICSNWPLLIS